jgi:hypothetical protein
VSSFQHRSQCKPNPHSLCITSAVCITQLDKVNSNLKCLLFLPSYGPSITVTCSITVTKITEIVQIFFTYRLVSFLDTQTYLGIASDKLHWSNYSEQELALYHCGEEWWEAVKSKQKCWIGGLLP